mmetsp:Transcript_13751/g.41038  ORF Transcript_13751/g.41038 Transcript_13751/m.41038 type:complete len:208 (+) Transcript_13751:331-954(+)
MRQNLPPLSSSSSLSFSSCSLLGATAMRKGLRALSWIERASPKACFGFGSEMMRTPPMSPQLRFARFASFGLRKATQRDLLFLRPAKSIAKPAASSRSPRILSASVGASRRGATLPGCVSMPIRRPGGSSMSILGSAFSTDVIMLDWSSSLSFSIVEGSSTGSRLPNSASQGAAVRVNRLPGTATRRPAAGRRPLQAANNQGGLPGL